jgi:hypothetical protein
VPTLVFILLLIPVSSIGLLSLLLGGTVWFKFLGIGLFGVTASLSEVTGVSLTAYFDTMTVKVYCVGTGFGFAFGPLYYTGKLYFNINIF